MKIRFEGVDATAPPPSAAMTVTVSLRDISTALDDTRFQFPVSRKSAVSNLPEVWLRGPVAEVPALLQPVAHALMQAREEVATALESFPDSLLWSRPAGVASVGFHLQHLVGVIDRLFTYARGEQLSSEQLAALKSESGPRDGDASTQSLVDDFGNAVKRAVEQLAAFDEAGLTQAREVGRARLPSTVLGLLFHAAEHSQRHVGQLLVTARVLRAGDAAAHRT